MSGSGSLEEQYPTVLVNITFAVFSMNGCVSCGKLIMMW